MTTTLISPPNGSVMASTSTPVVLTIDTNLANATIVTRYPDGSLFEVVYFDSAFAPLYVTSAIVGTQFTITRQGGWPADLTVSVQEASSSGALCPTLYGPVAQWALRGAPVTATTYADRSGNAVNFTAGTPLPCPDMITGQLALTNRTTSPNRLTVTSAPLRISGTLTIVARVWVKGTGAAQNLLEQGGSTGVQADNALYVIAMSAGGKFAYFYETGASVDHTVTSTLSIDDGQWHFIALRRDASGNVTFTVDGTSETIAAGLPDGGSTGFFTIMDDDGGTAPWQGGLADLNIWNIRLTDVQIAGLRTVMMGL